MNISTMAALVVLLGVTAPAMATPPDVWSFNEACDRALRSADYPNAIYKCEAAADLAVRLRSGAPEQATAFENLAQLRVDQGQFDDATLLAQQAADVTEAVFGADDPMMVPALRRQADILQVTGNISLAERKLLRAQAILGLSYEPDDLEIAETQGQLGILYLASHRYQEAYTAFNAAHASLIRYYGEENLPSSDLPQLLERARRELNCQDTVAP
ncbi:tetratricopeptide repeat protein [Hydrocarboniphaga sp.]|uniref:tetratricopeptide repeat protein n=1 Tax=Hydrocarboniphaga sp. TaxID=2033016 RepID=UPI003D0F3A1B